MRLFIAIDFDKYTKQKIYELQKEIRARSIKGRWKHIDNFHLTLKFLGEVSQEKLSLLDNLLNSIAFSNQRFWIKLDQVGYFDGNDSIRVIWIGVDGEIEKLNELYYKIENQLYSIGFEKEKRQYKPHITIAQDVVFNHSFENIKNIFSKHRFDKVYINKIVLMKSEQVGNKRVYTPVNEYVLGKG